LHPNALSTLGQSGADIGTTFAADLPMCWMSLSMSKEEIMANKNQDRLRARDLDAVDRGSGRSFMQFPSMGDYGYANGGRNIDCDLAATYKHDRFRSEGNDWHRIRTDRSFLIDDQDSGGHVPTVRPSGRVGDCSSYGRYGRR
jgi:hypothetical protein